MTSELAGKVQGMKRFYGDLWNADRPTIEAAARAILTRRGADVVRVFGLGSGLFVSVLLAGGQLVTVSDEEIRREVWS